ncbi:MAG: LPS-assembly protein LptD, partial [Bacteroidales bacterium]|nr:LPS-assembly protein LptD [Bacteroidales bacterium]
MFTKNKKTVLFIIFWVINIIHIAAYSSESAVYIFSTQDIDSLSVNDTLTNDTLKRKEKRKSKNILDSPIDYSAEDSILFSLDNKKVFLYGNSVITYQDMELKSAFIELDLDNNEIYAIGLPDSSGVITGNPVFTEKNESYEAIEMRYNFKTRKGIITEVVTEQSDGYLHAEKTKRQANGEIHLYKGKYTTCDQAHPHFYIALTKAKAIPNDKVISGPAYLVVEDVPLYFPIIPFGFFPSTKTQTSGIIVPEYGEENLRGFYLRGGGYYWAISDYMDLNLTGDFYTSGTSGGTGQLRYKKRYRFSGNLNVRAYSNASGDIDIPNYINEAAGRQRKN